MPEPTKKAGRTVSAAVASAIAAGSAGVGAAASSYARFSVVESQALTLTADNVNIEKRLEMVESRSSANQASMVALKNAIDRLSRSVDVLIDAVITQRDDVINQRINKSMENFR